jgi:hypothetical protein
MNPTTENSITAPVQFLASLSFELERRKEKEQTQNTNTRMNNK